MYNFIQFKKERELGDILSDTFKFIRENYKPLFKALVKYAGPVFLLQLFALGYYSYVTLGSTSNIFLENTIDQNFGFNILLSLLFMILTAVAYQAFMYGTIQHCIRSYIENKGEINVDEVGDGMGQDWSSFLGLGFAVSIMTFIGLIFCFLPGIYLAVPLSLVYSIKTFKQLGFSETISYTFTLIKDNWWITFLTLFVMLIIVYLMSMIFQMPALIYSLTKTFTAVDQGSFADPSFMFDWVYLVLSIIGSAASNLLYGILAITIGLIYFNLNEQKNHTGAYESIENLGKDQ
jgi:hypothetical protein